MAHSNQLFDLAARSPATLWPYGVTCRLGEVNCDGPLVLVVVLVLVTSCCWARGEPAEGHPKP